MKKVLFVISSLRGGGAERVLSVLANELSTYSNLEISILLLDNCSQAYTLDSNVKLLTLKKKKTNWTKIGRTLSLIKSIRKSIDSYDPDIVIPFMTETSILVYLAIKGSYPQIASEHGVFRDRGTIINWLRSFVFKRINHIVCLNHHDYNELRKLNKNVSIIHNPSHFKAPSINNKEREAYVICVGSLDRYEEKGIHILVGIWQAIVKEAPNFKLHILGGGNEANQQQLQSLIADLGLQSSVILEGFQDDLSPWYKKAEMLISASEMESFSMILVEAQSMGCPIISFDCPYGPAEIINNNIDGILVPNQDLEKLTKAILYLHSNDKVRSDLSNNGLINSKRFDKDVIAKKWAELINDII
ncbi:glycosyltransferase [Porphyromonas somerae]|uniref:glycosyltransferase n=1 Tax=Porphyromonas somerae TaxID=322095 RepID=UPI00037B009F|nr:glycosyltransferase [Porphyromonas somerae]